VEVSFEGKKKKGKKIPNGKEGVTRASFIAFGSKATVALRPGGGQKTPFERKKKKLIPVARTGARSSTKGGGGNMRFRNGKKSNGRLERVVNEKEGAGLGGGSPGEGGGKVGEKIHMALS